MYNRCIFFPAKSLIPSGPLSKGKSLDGMLLKEDINAPLKVSSWNTNHRGNTVQNSE